MAQWSDLTPVQQQQIQAYMSLLRSSVGAYARLLKDIQKLKDAGDGGLTALIATINTGNINDTTGLSGADTLNATDVATISTTLFNALSGNYKLADREFYIRIVGLANV